MRPYSALIVVLSLVVVFAAGIVSVQAQILTPQLTEVASTFRQFIDIGTVPIVVPTVIEVPIDAVFLERYDFAILNLTTNNFEPFFFKQETVTQEVPLTVLANIPAPTAYLVDKDERTEVDFVLPERSGGIVQLVLQSAEPITSSTLVTLLSNNVALPTSVEIRAMVKGVNQIVVAQRTMDQQTVRFPTVTSNEWIITFTYAQPLRLAELRLIQEQQSQSVHSKAVRFLAQPQHAYRVFLDADRSVVAFVSEAGNLAINEGVMRISSSPAQTNPSYVMADADQDGVPNVRDNCVAEWNADQSDINANGGGDVCEDFDKDGVMNDWDNCPNYPNREQADIDADGIGDVCDPEESRITERHGWIPWAGIGFAALVLVVLFALTTQSMTISKTDVKLANNSKENSDMVSPTSGQNKK